MVGTVEQEFRAAGNGTELADYQPLVVDRIMVKHIVSLEKQRVRSACRLYVDISFSSQHSDFECNKSCCTRRHDTSHNYEFGIMAKQERTNLL